MNKMVMMKKAMISREAAVLAATFAVMVIMPTGVWASSASSIAGGAFAWIGSATQMISQVAQAVMVLMIVICGIVLAKSRAEEGMSKMATAIMGCSIAVFGVSLASALGFSGATF